MKFFVCVILLGAVLAIVHAEEQKQQNQQGMVGSAYGKPPSYAPPPPAYSAPAYAPAPAPIYSAPALSYNVPAPQIPCSRAVVVSCAPSVAAAPCSPPPAYGAPGY